MKHDVLCLNRKLGVYAMNSRNLLTTQQAADILGVSKAFLEKDRWAGAKIPFVKLGKTRAVRYKLEDLENFINSQTIQPFAKDRGNGHS